MNKQELLESKWELENELSNIDGQLEEIEEEEKNRIERKDSVQNKTKLSQLTSSDQIYLVKFLPHIDGIYHEGYVDIGGISKSEDFYYLTVSHETEPIGFSSGFNSKYENRYCVLLEHCGQYDFITMKPDHWEQDIKVAMEDLINDENSRHNNNMDRHRNNLKKALK